MRCEDLTGKRFGRWTVLRYSHTKKARYWVCECVCGNKSVLPTSPLIRGDTKSCGCLTKEMAVKRHTTHGARCRSKKSPISSEYRRWASIKTRCYNPKNKDYGRYGGRGIRVCARWLNSFESFFEDMGPCPPGLTIERIDNDGDYEPGNCEWIPASEQYKNKRNTVLLTYKGVTKILRQWARDLGVHHTTIQQRLQKGWSFAKVVKYYENIKEGN